MNRAHGAGQALASLQLAQEQGYDNISADLIYGGPTLPDDRWQKNVEQVLRLGIPHLSCYALTVEPRTALDKMIRGKKLVAVDPDAQARQFLLLLDWLEAAGYEQYEISNFSLPGKRSRHNSSYWQGLTYLGLGPSAHAYNGSSRQWNVANNSRYIDSLLAGQLNFEKEELSPNTQLNEYIMISLRTREGCDLQRDRRAIWGDLAPGSACKGGTVYTGRKDGRGQREACSDARREITCGRYRVGSVLLKTFVFRRSLQYPCSISTSAILRLPPPTGTAPSARWP